MVTWKTRQNELHINVLVLDCFYFIFWWSEKWFTYHVCP